MKLVYFGTFSISEGYPRNEVIVNCLRSAGLDIIYCHCDVWGDAESRVRDVSDIPSGIKRLLKLIKAWIFLIVNYLLHIKDHDVILVGYPGHLDVMIAFILSRIRSKPIIFDAFIPLYEAIIEDRKLFQKNSIKANFLKFLDKVTVKLPDAVLIDTDAHIEYYASLAGSTPVKFTRLFVSAVEEYFYPRSNSKENRGDVLFFGTFLPLHGTDVIIRAAGLLKNRLDIQFTMIGKGPELKKCKELAKQVNTKISWIEQWMSYSELAERIAKAEICLGIFSTEPKASRVIPCKVFNILAMQKPLITADTPAIREALTDRNNALLVPAGNSERLANAILELHDNKELRNYIAANGFALFQTKFSKEAIKKILIEQLDRIIENRGRNNE